VVHWSGYTSGYQAKRIDNTSTRDEPYEFVLGSGDTIDAFNEAVAGMRPGAIRRVEVPGEAPSLSYPINRKERFTDELFDKEGRVYRYRKGPQPAELGGQRALDFVLDNRTLQDFNRTLLFDIRLLSVRRKR
jgi:FKBP-type peptidyl-prolyl cis-trans isomerase 2